MISAIKDSSIKKNRKKSFRVTFAPGTKTEEEQINSFVKAVECKGPGIDDLSKMIKNLPTKKTQEKQHDEEAEKISNMIYYLRKTLDNMLEKECNSPELKGQKVKLENEKEKRTSSSSIDSAIGDCSKSSDYYNDLKDKEEESETRSIQSNEQNKLEKNVNKEKDTTVYSPHTRQKVSELLKELDSCIEEIKEDVFLSEDETCQLYENNICVKDVFASGILIASFVHTFTEMTVLEQQYAILTDNKIYIFGSNRSKSPLKNIFLFNENTTIKKSEYMKNALELTGEYDNNCNEIISENITIVFSSEEECNIWMKLLLDIMKTKYNSNKYYPKRTTSLKNSSPVMHKSCRESYDDYYNPRQTILSALCVLEGYEKSF